MNHLLSTNNNTVTPNIIVCDNNCTNTCGDGCYTTCLFACTIGCSYDAHKY